MEMRLNQWAIKIASNVGRLDFYGQCNIFEWASILEWDFLARFKDLMEALLDSSLFEEDLHCYQC